MNRVDGVILGVGVVVLVASIIGVVLYDDAAGPAFEVTWQESSEQQLQEQTDSGAAGEYSFEVPINETGLARALFTVEVTRNGFTNGDTVEVEVSGPGGRTGSCTLQVSQGATGSGSCEAEVDVQEAPDETTINAEDSETAESQAEEDLSTAGTGTWNATVTVQQGTGLPGPGAAAYTVTLAPAYTLWEANAQPPSPGGTGGP